MSPRLDRHFAGKKDSSGLIRMPSCPRRGRRQLRKVKMADQEVYKWKELPLESCWDRCYANFLLPRWIPARKVADDCAGLSSVRFIPAEAG